MSIDMTLQKWAIFIMGVYGEILCLSADQAEIMFLVIQGVPKKTEPCIEYAKYKNSVNIAK